MRFREVVLWSSNFFVLLVAIVTMKVNRNEFSGTLVSSICFKYACYVKGPQMELFWYLSRYWVQQNMTDHQLCKNRSLLGEEKVQATLTKQDLCTVYGFFLKFPTNIRPLPFLMNTHKKYSTRKCPLPCKDGWKFRLTSISKSSFSKGRYQSHSQSVHPKLLFEPWTGKGKQ